MPRAARLALALATSAFALSAGAVGDKPPPHETARADEAPVADPMEARAAALLAELERDRAAPRALSLLVELSTLEGELSDLGKLAVAYGDVAEATTANPEVRAYARFRLADLERARGNLRRSEAELAQLAFLGGWQIAGPFDNDGKRGFDEVYPPEEEQDLAKRYPGKAREVGWRPLPPEALVAGFAHLGAAVRPAREVVVYALTVVDAPRDERAVLHLGASGAVKVFLNGALVHADPTYHRARLDTSAVEVGLRQGPNRILVKLCHAEGMLGFFARLADVRGAPLQLRAAKLMPLPRLQRPAAKAAPRPGVLAALEARARAARGAAAGPAYYDLALALAERRPGEDRERRAAAEARRAARLMPGSVQARLLAARLDEDGNRRREQLEAAVESHPDDPRALAALGRHELSHNRLARAQRLLERAVKAAPRFAGARLALADLHEQAGLAARAQGERVALARELPFHPGAVAAAVRGLRAQDRLEEAAPLLRKALALRFDDAAARASLVQVLLQRADLDGAVRLLQEAIRLDPADLEARLRLADLLAGNGRADQAEDAYAAALRIVPDEAEILERRGQARLRAGHAQEALADFQAALDLKPQNPQLKELVRAIEPKREPFERPYLRDARLLAASAPAPQPGEDAIVLADVKVTKVFPSGLSSGVHQLVVKVLTQRGADAWRRWSTGYTPDRQEVKVARARVLKPDGAEVDTYQESDHSASEPWYRLYYDTRARQLGFPALAPGDVLEIAVRTDDVASENLLSDYFGEVVFFGDDTRRALTEYVLLAPEGRKIFASDPALAGLVKSERPLEDGVVERRWAAKGVPRLRPEPAMPGWSEVAPYLHVSTYASWDDVARFYWGLVREQLAVTPEIREVALRIASDVRREQREARSPEALERALVQAVHRFVVTNTRYVALEFGIHGFKPYRVDQILDRRFGDCKDKASLTHALLEALGIDSRLVLLRMRRLGRMPEKPASLAVFNHAILYVPKLDLWLDGTASYSGSRDLPGEDRGATVLVVNPGAPARFTTIPEGHAEDNRTESQYQVALAADGSAAVVGEARVAGVQAPGYRRAYAAEGDRRVQLEQAMSRTFPGLSVEKVATSDLGRLEDDVRLQFTLALPRLAERQGDGLRLPPFGGGQRFTETLAPLSARERDLVLGAPWEARLAYRYALPAGWRAAEVPPAAKLEGAFAAFEVSYREESGALLAETRVRMKASRVPAADYGAFRDFLSQVDRALARPVRLAPAPPPAAAAR
jgi:tetratricopeptide (TPR) repeat protein/transglutaminase-like putative cysteine protease